MNSDDLNSGTAVCVHTDPGICGFTCTIKAWKSGKRMVAVEITGSECQQIQAMGTFLKQMSLKDVFLPLTRNPAYCAAERSGCHSSCVIPAAVLKTAEAALGMAIPKEVRIEFRIVASGKEDPEVEEKNEIRKCRSI